jgi:hypothetical protein
MRRSMLGHWVLWLAAAGGVACSRSEERRSSRPAERNEPSAERPDAGMMPPGALTPASRTDDPAPVPRTEEPKPAEPKDPLAEADADMKKVLEAMDTLGVKPIGTHTAEQSRRQPSPADAVKAV